MEANETARKVDPAIHVAPETRGASRGLKTVTFALAMMAAGHSTVAPASAQETGTVEDAATGEPLASAQISVPALGVGVLASASGLFVLPDVPVGTHELRAERLGYAAAPMNVTVTTESRGRESR